MQSTAENLFSTVRAKLQLAPLKYTPPPPALPLPPRAGQEIVPLLAARYGLGDIPPGLRKIAEQGHADLCPANMARISVGMASCGQASGAGPWATRLAARPDFVNRVIVRNVGCLGACYGEPLVDVRTTEGLHYLFGRVSSEVHWPIIRTAQQQSLQRGAWLVLRERHPGLLTGFGDLEIIKSYRDSFAAFFEHQKRLITGNCGLIDPLSLPEYVATGGYFALAKALIKQSPADIVAEISASGLRGRGGGGFNTGWKWETAAASSDRRRFIVANADEGDPGAYMDRTLMESDPHRVLEGIILASYACGAGEAYIFVRHEYPLAVARLRQAIADARAAGLLGERILGTDFALQVGIIQSGGAFVCGEESSLLQVMQGQRGEPWPRPPYPSEQGFHGHPTVINNVETLANVPWIIAHGADAFRAAGNDDSPGTKIFCITGDIPNTGFIEVPLGASVRTVVENIGGAAHNEIKALQIGGPSGGIVPYKDFALDYSSLSTAGGMIGSGGLVVLNHSRCLVDLTRHLTGFMADESCGQCLFCRDGLALLTGMLDNLTTGTGKPGLIEQLEELSRAVADMSMCALGRTAVNPLLTTIRHFRSEYEAHLAGVCPAVTCKPLIRFEIIPSRCTDCRGCLDCPVQAISRQAGQGPLGYSVDHEKCIRCRSCAEICPHDAIRAVSGGDRP